MSESEPGLSTGGEPVGEGKLAAVRSPVTGQRNRELDRDERRTCDQHIFPRSADRRQAPDGADGPWGKR